MTAREGVLTGGNDEPIRLVEYEADWPLMFEREAKALVGRLHGWITGGVHHVGSTAVPGLMAKPTIDIQVGVADLASTRPCIELLADLNYCYAPHRADGMHWFCKPSPQRRTHHLHLVPTGSMRFRDVLAFRDYLREHPSSAREYELLKVELARRLAGDREAYTEEKADFIAKILRSAHDGK